MSKPNTAKSSPFSHAVRDQIEAFAMAILMAIGLKYFLVEAFQIPTPSMQPVLMGSPSTGIHDRILVDKAAYLTNKPDRWHVAVFRYPHNQSQNYVKRIVGLSDEKLRIFNGDIYKNYPAQGDKAPYWETVRKPRGLQDHLWKEMWSQNAEDRASIARMFAIDRGLGGTWSVDNDGTVHAKTVGGEATRTTLEMVKPENRYADGYPRELRAKLAEEANGGENLVVADVDWRANVTTTDATKAIELRAVEQTSAGKSLAWRVRVERGGDGRGKVTLDWFAKGSDLLRSKEPTQRVTAEDTIAFGAGSEFELRLANWDDQCFGSAGGVALGPITYRTDFDATIGLAMEIVVEGNADIRGTTLARDNTYERWLDDQGRFSNDVVHVPPGHCWMLGDNQRNSDDGRTWRRMTLWQKDGKIVAPETGDPITGNARFEFENRPGSLGVDENPVVVPQKGRIVFTDLYGEEHVLEGTPDDLLRSARFWRVEDQEENARFVPERFFVGRAFATFFPISRLGLIR
ncbi:MAG: signal peptidase I [Planctomycetes bacterium]|nr:signal peptidase I [Planctomycetota bacterium]